MTKSLLKENVWVASWQGWTYASLYAMIEFVYWVVPSCLSACTVPVASRLVT